MQARSTPIVSVAKIVRIKLEHLPFIFPHIRTASEDELGAGGPLAELSLGDHGVGWRPTAGGVFGS